MPVRRLISPQEWVEKQQQGVTSVGQSRYVAGVNNPKKDPIEAGIAAQPAYDAAMSNPQIRARRVRGLARTNLAEWTAAATNKGANRYVEGATASREKLTRGVQRYHGFLQQHVATLDNMPAATPQDRERKMVENLRGLRGFKDQQG